MPRAAKLAPNPALASWSCANYVKEVRVTESLQPFTYHRALAVWRDFLRRSIIRFVSADDG